MQIELDKELNIAIVSPSDALSENDFKEIAKVIDPQITEVGKLNGLVIHTQSFPGWESITSMISHFKFVNNHHAKISKVALVSDSKLTGVMEKVAPHFVSAKIQTFSYDNLNEAKTWVTTATSE